MRSGCTMKGFIVQEKISGYELRVGIAMGACGECTNLCVSLFNSRSDHHLLSTNEKVMRQATSREKQIRGVLRKSWRGKVDRTN
uniref:Uncharacterized protein n=1 Tax=Setaria digitata TaxID=48799 RepID=A0A915PE43_9BILA